MNPVATQLVGSVGFSDLVGFTDYTDALGDEAAVGVLDQQKNLIDLVLARHPGTRVVKELGDGLLIWSPDAPSALSSASEFLAAVGADHQGGSFPLTVRMGIHHGPVSRRGDDVVGQTVNVAARIAALAGPSELLVSDELLAACGNVEHGVVEAGVVEAIGPVPVKGVSAPVWLHRIEWLALTS